MSKIQSFGKIFHMDYTVHVPKEMVKRKFIRISKKGTSILVHGIEKKLLVYNHLKIYTYKNKKGFIYLFYGGVSGVRNGPALKQVNVLPQQFLDDEHCSEPQDKQAGSLMGSE